MAATDVRQILHEQNTLVMLLLTPAGLSCSASPVDLLINESGTRTWHCPAGLSSPASPVNLSINEGGTRTWNSGTKKTQETDITVAWFWRAREPVPIALIVLFVYDLSGGTNPPSVLSAPRGLTRGIPRTHWQICFSRSELQSLLRYDGLHSR